MQNEAICFDDENTKKDQRGQIKNKWTKIKKISEVIFLTEKKKKKRKKQK